MHATIMLVNSIEDIEDEICSHSIAHYHDNKEIQNLPNYVLHELHKLSFTFKCFLCVPFEHDALNDRKKFLNCNMMNIRCLLVTHCQNHEFSSIYKAILNGKIA